MRFRYLSHWQVMGPVAQSVASSTADPGVASLILTQSHFVEFDHEIISTIIPPPADSRRVVVSYKQKSVHKVLINHLFKRAQEKAWLSELSRHDHSRWLSRKESNQTQTKHWRVALAQTILNISTVWPEAILLA